MFLNVKLIHLTIFETFFRIPSFMFRKEASCTMFETAWRFLNDGRIVIFRWTAPCTASLPPRRFIFLPAWILPRPPQPVPYWLLTVTLSILCCQCQTDSVAEADRWSVWKGGAWGHVGRGGGSCVGVRESSHGADPNDHNSFTPSHYVWSICHYEGREYGEREGGGKKAILTQPGTGSVNAGVFVRKILYTHLSRYHIFLDMWMAKCHAWLDFKTSWLL